MSESFNFYKRRIAEAMSSAQLSGIAQRMAADKYLTTQELAELRVLIGDRITREAKEANEKYGFHENHGNPLEEIQA